MEIVPIARIKTDFSQKFGIPRQSGIAPHLQGRIVFEPAFANPDALRGIEGFSHLWLIWEFDGMNRPKTWQPTVRPPRLGGNERMGVFATRSPNRPNSLGLSVVKLERVEMATAEGPVLHVLGADLRNDTPIYDIKPYLPYADAIPDATGGFTDSEPRRQVAVVFPEDKLEAVPLEKREALVEVLRQDPRPQYHDDPERVYAMAFAGLDVRFVVAGDALTVIAVDGVER